MASRLFQPTSIEKAPEPALRGDPIAGERYWSREFMEQEWQQMWTRVWHIGGRESQLLTPNSFITHEIGRESILMVRQGDGTIKAFFNVCLHRGNRLVPAETGKAPRFVCAYHSWAWRTDGSLAAARQREDFPQGDPCARMRLREIPCDTWGGFVWFNMDAACASLREYLHPIAEQIDPYQPEKWVRVLHLTAEVPCNWKVIHDNFNESYHLPTLHRELNTFIEDSYLETQFDMYESGHNRMLMKAGLPARSSGDAAELRSPLTEILSAWDLDPATFNRSARDARLALQRQKRQLAKARGCWQYEYLTDDQLTDYFHYTLFPNTSLTMGADGFQVLRPQPHPTDPERCIFDHWFLVPQLEGASTAQTPVGPRPVSEAAHEVFKHGEQSLGFVADQDLSIAVGQQMGLRSRAFEDAYLSGQESRIRRYHEVLNDYIAGRR